jgi:Na+/H+-dicarboxylate symporter
MKSKLTLYIGVALVIGIVLGFILNKNYVGTENEKIANAARISNVIQTRMASLEAPKDSLAAKRLLEIKSSLTGQKNNLQKMILAGAGTEQFPQIKTLADSIKKTDLQLALLSDTLTQQYKDLKTQKEIVNFEKAAITKTRDNKLDWFSLLADIFLRLIKMIVAPLVFTTLVVGVAKLGDGKSVGRIGGKTMLWFISASLLSLTLGCILVNIFQPGIAMHLPLPESNLATGIDKTSLNLKDFFYHVFPASFVDAMAKNEILQIVVFSIFFGIACGALGEIAKPIIKALDVAAHIILKITGYVMKFAPVAVFGAITAVIAKQGLGILKTYSIFIGEFYFGLFALWCLLILAGYVFLKKRVFNLVKRIKEPILLAFSTSSSEAAFPKTLTELERFGCSNKIVSFVLPLGYSFNLDGSMMYMTFASLFIAQSYGIHLDIGTQISMLLVLMLTSKGIAGVPRASLVVIAATLVSFNIPEAGIALLLGIDPILDMGRSATNVVGNSIATAVVSKWENELKEHH